MDATSNSILDDQHCARIPGYWRDSSAELSDTDVSRVTRITPNRPRSSGTTPSQSTDRRGRHVSPQTYQQYLASCRDLEDPSCDDSPSSEVDSIFERSSISRAKTPLTPPDFADSNSRKRCHGPPSPSPLCQSRTCASSTLDGSPSRPRRTLAQRPTSTLLDLSDISDLQLSIENDTILTPSDTLDRKRDPDINPSGEVGHAPETRHDPDAVPIFERFKSTIKSVNSINNDLFRQIRRRNRQKKINAGKAVPSDTTLGYIYIFTLPSCPGFVKIGKTKIAPQDRVSQQRNACRLPYGLIEDSNDKPFREYGAVERLVMAELYNCRRKFECSKCRNVHGEWYEVSKEKALEVVERWRRWMVLGEPYANNGLLNPFWVRKYDESITSPANVRWKEWLCPPAPLPPYRCYLSLAIKGGTALLSAFYAFMMHRREQGRRDSRCEMICHRGTPMHWLAFWGLCSILWAYLGKVGITIGAVAAVGLL